MPSLSERTALLVGAGGLGVPAAWVLAQAGLAQGLSRLVVCDPDRVETSNLHRQVSYGEAMVGRPKARALAEALGQRWPSLRVVPVERRLAAENAAELLADVDVVVDGSDNFATKFLVNDACVLAGVPFVHAAAVRWQGQLLAVDPASGAPCYRCLFEEPPPAREGTSCAEAGVVGPVVGVVGALAGEAALRLLDGGPPTDEPGLGALTVYDGLAGALRTVRFRKNPLCRACGASAPARIQRLDPRDYSRSPTPNAEACAC